MTRDPPRRSTLSARLMFGVVAAALLSAGIVGWYLASPTSPPPVPSAPTAPYGPSWGTPVNSSGAVSVGCPAVSGHYCYEIELAGGGNFELTGVELSLRNGSGESVAWPAPPANDTVSLECAYPPGACAQYDSAAATWTVYGANPTTLVGGETVVISTAGIGPTFGLRGDALVLTDPEEGLTYGTVSNPFP